MDETAPAAVADSFALIATNDVARRRLDADQISVIADVCDRWLVDQDDAHAACERLIEGGADGTTMIGEFLALELGPILRISPTTAALRIADVLNLRDRHPKLWAAVQDLKVEYWKATQITRATRHLGVDAARWVDRQVTIALMTMPWARLMRSLETIIAKADPALAAERAESERQRRMVIVGHYSDGGGTVYARLSAADAAQLDETVSDLANRLATPDSELTTDQRRAVALGLLAEPDTQQSSPATTPPPRGRRPCSSTSPRGPLSPTRSTRSPRSKASGR